MDCDALRDDQWERLKDFFPGGRRGKRGPRTDNRRFLDALLWMARSGGRWRDLPARLGDYRTVKRRYYRWIEMGVLDLMLEAQPWLGGAAYGLADVAYVPWILRARQLLGVDFGSYPALRDWVARMLERPAVAAEQGIVAAL